MLTLESLNSRNYPTTSIIDSNLLVLYQRLKYVESKWIEYCLSRANSVELHWAEYAAAGFKNNSGLRSERQQTEMIKAGKTTAVNSKHLVGLAADISDPSPGFDNDGVAICGPIKLWLRAEPQVLMISDLWCEHWEATPSWWHAQAAPPSSGRRWFFP